MKYLMLFANAYLYSCYLWVKATKSNFTHGNNKQQQFRKTTMKEEKHCCGCSEADIRIVAVKNSDVGADIGRRRTARRAEGWLVHKQEPWHVIWEQSERSMAGTSRYSMHDPPHHGVSDTVLRPLFRSLNNYSFINIPVIGMRGMASV